MMTRERMEMLLLLRYLWYRFVCRLYGWKARPYTKWLYYDARRCCR